MAPGNRLGRSAADGAGDSPGHRGGHRRGDLGSRGALPVDNAPANDSALVESSPAPMAVAPPGDSKRTSSSGWGSLPVTGVTLTGLVLAAGLLGAGFTLRGFRRRPVQET